jgi:serine/threonine protein kinase
MLIHCSGLNYLHEHKDPIIHGNLAPQNLLQNEAGQLKVSDFGLLGSHIRSITSSSSDINAYAYMAPELYRKEAFQKNVDVFSFGIILHEMFEGPQNLEGLAPETIAKKRAYEDARPTFSSQSYPRGMKELISDCWDKDPSKRPAFSVIIQRLEEMKPLKDNEQKCQCVIL